MLLAICTTQVKKQNKNKNTHKKLKYIFKRKKKNFLVEGSTTDPQNQLEL